MFQDFFKNLYFQNLKVKAHNLIGQKKLFIHTHPRMWMFFASLMLVAITLLCVKPEFAKGVSESLPIKEANASNAPGTTAETPNWVKTDVLTAQQKEEHSKLDELKQKQRVASWISKRYKIANKASNLFVTTAYKTAFDIGLDPHLILAVMAIESRFNPYAESSMGAQGLMQVMAKVHADKFEDHGGVQYALDPVVNIKVGSRILKEYVRQTGSVERALKTYVGAAQMSHDNGYGNKVIGEYKMLKAVASGSKVSTLAQAKTTDKRSARYAYSEATVPKVTVILRKAYGGGYIAMNSRHLKADFMFAWPTAEIAVMGPEGAANIIFRKEIKESANPEETRKQKVAEYREKFANPYVAASKGYIDSVIEPSETRLLLKHSIEVSGNKTVMTPAKKHGIPPF